MAENQSLYDTKQHLDFLKLDYLQRIMEVESPQAVQAAAAYASALNEIGVNADNYPLFFEVINTNNDWVIDNLTEGKDLETFFTPVIPTYYIIQQLFELFSKKLRYELNEKIMRMLLGYLRLVYADPHHGFELYPVTIPDVNHMTKHLREKKGEDEPVNRLILELLRSLNQMNELSSYRNERVEKVDVASQAGKLRSCFFDTKREMRNAISDVLLQEGKPEPGVKPEYLYAG